MFSGNHVGSRINSGGIDGMSAHDHCPLSASHRWVNTLAPSTPPASRTNVAAFSMWLASTGSPARRKRRVRLDGRREVGRAVGERRPRAVVALLRADPRRGGVGLRRSADAEELAQQQVLGVDRDVRLQLALPPAIGVLHSEQRLHAAVARGQRPCGVDRNRAAHW